MKTKKILFFLVGGIANYAVKIGLTILLTEILRLKYFISYPISLTALIVFGFYYNFHITFNNKTAKKERFIAYTISLLLFVLTDYLSVVLLTNFLGIYYVISIILVTTVMVIAKFIVFDRVIFNENIYYEQMKGGNYYNKHKSNNPVVILLMRLFHNDLFKYIEAIKPKTLLDIGCGEGFTTMEIIKKFPMINVEMREYDPEMVGKAKQLHGSLQVKHGDITFIKEPNNSYDLVLATEVLEHLETPLKAIEELKRVSCRYVLITVPNEPYWRIANILRGSYLASLGNTPGHIQHWTKNQLRNLLRRYFKKVKIKTSTLWNIALCEK